jgi:4-hydroxythreonine-4-phosphate dehydrogenase
MKVPRIGISLGDPAGIGPEIILKALGEEPPLPAASYILFGDARILEDQARRLGLRTDDPRWRDEPAGDAPGVFLQNIPTPRAGAAPGSATKEDGKASFLYFEAAVEQARRGALDALVTAPISKSAWELAGIRWRGHTEYLEQIYPGAIMTFWSERLKVALLSHHLPLAEALKRIRKDRLADFLENLSRSLERISPGRFELLVAGLNPHAGEEGLMGGEESREIAPAIAAARAAGIRVSGPFPPDTVFLKALDRTGLVVVGLYHDQGLIAFKTVAFDGGVNATLGLPFVRTSPDHGTAFDIAGRNVANPRSLVAAVRLAWDFVRSTERR